MNALAPLAITTYDGSGQSVHPDVLSVPAWFAGYPYWLASTPYPFSRDRLENPCLRASNDGYHWVLPEGVPDPVIPVPEHPREHHADPALAYADGRLYMYYVTTNERDRRTRFSVVSSDDGSKWTVPAIVYEGAFGVSPSVLVRGEQWHMWYVDYDSDRRANRSELKLRSGGAPDEFGAPVACVADIPGHILWHIDVIEVAGGFEALLTAFPRSASVSSCRLFHAVSSDGRVFTLSSVEPLLTPSRGGWDGRIIYRSSFLKDAGSRYRVWYSAASWASTWGIGYVEGPLDDLRPNAKAPTAPRAGGRLQDVIGFTRYKVGRILPRSVASAVRRVLPR